MAPTQHQRTTPARRQRTRERPLRDGQHSSPKVATRITSLDQCRAALQESHLARTREVFAYRDKALALIEELKESCRAHLREEEACLEWLDRLNPTPDELITFHTALQGLRQPIPERLVFAENGLIVSFMPEEEEENEDQVTGPKVDTISNNPSTDTSPSITNAGPSCPSATPTISTSRTRQTNTQNDPIPSRPLKTVSSRRQGHPKRKRRIKPREVKAGHYWVFEHGRRAKASKMYILRCPNESCQQPVFSQHPLKADRAVSHFKACGVPFKKVSDLVSLYADVVVPERPSRPLTRKWAKEHNETLIGVKEDFLHAENIWPGVDESDADELH